MKPPSKKELVILGSISLIATASWLWLAQPHNLHDALLVLLTGVSGIAATLFTVGLINRFYTKNKLDNHEEVVNSDCDH